MPRRVCAIGKYRDALPQLSDEVYLTDGGLETTLVFHEGIDLPEFAAFVLLADDEGTETLRQYFRRYLAVARDAGVGFVGEAPTWRANPDWAEKVGYDRDALERANRRSIELLTELRAEHEATAPFVISGNIGPRDDGYNPSSLMTADEAQAYHAQQIGTFADTDADYVSAFTMTYPDEAIGITRAAQQAGMPVVISFTAETDGRLPTGSTLGDAIDAVDRATDRGPAYFMINCAHPDHFESAIRTDDAWVERIRGLRANSSRRSHAELDEAEELDEGDPQELGSEYARLRAQHPTLTVLGGCCGTDHRHVEAIAAACAS